jgi:outer membrane protein assembly factor BamB
MPTPVYLVEKGVPKIIFTGGDLHVYAVNARTGAVLWKRPTPGADQMSSLNLYNGLIYGVSGYSSLLFDATYQKYGAAAARKMFQHTWAINTNGEFKWSLPYGQRGCSPTIANGTVFVESWLPESGDNPTTWRQQLWAPLGGWVLYSVIIESSHNEIAALDARTGAAKWVHRFQPGTATDEGTHMNAVAGFYSDGHFYDSVPILNTFVALDAKTGRLVWSIPTAATVKMSAVEKDGLIYFGDARGTLYVVRASDGTVEQKVKFPHGFSISPPLIVGNTLFVANTNSIYAVRLSDLQRGIAPAN